MLDGDGKCLINTETELASMKTKIAELEVAGDL